MTARISTASQAQLGRIARGGAFNLVGAVVSAVSVFVLVVVVANNFPTDVAGMLFSATSTFLIVVAVAALGTDTGLIRFLRRYEAHGQHGDVRTAVRVAFRPVMATSLVLALAIVAGADWIAPLIGLGRRWCNNATATRRGRPVCIAQRLLAGTHAGLRPHASHRRR